MFKIGANGLFQRCIFGAKIKYILWHCHNLPYEGHFSGDKIVVKVLQLGFFLPSLFRDAFEHCRNCERCQRTGNISRRHEMLLQNIIKVEIFYFWGMDFIGPLPMFHSHVYILVVVVTYLNGWR